MFGEKDEEEQKKRSSLFSHKQEEDVKRGSRESLKRWAKRGKNGLQLKKKTGGKEAQHVSGQQEVPHHSKELAEDGEEKKKKRDTQRSPEEKELQMLASRAPEERKGLEEEGSASRKTEVRFPLLSSQVLKE